MTDDRNDLGDTDAQGAADGPRKRMPLIIRRRRRCNRNVGSGVPRTKRRFSRSTEMSEAKRSLASRVYFSEAYGAMPMSLYSCSSGVNPMAPVTRP